MALRKQRKSQGKQATSPTLAEDLSKMSETQLEMAISKASELTMLGGLSMIQRKAARYRMSQKTLKVSQNQAAEEQTNKQIS